MTDARAGGSAPLVSVVVACSRPERLRGIAEALAQESSASGVSVELAACGAVEGLDAAGWPVPTTLVVCRQTHPNLRRQLAIDASAGPIVAFVDDDALPQPGWLSAAGALPVDGDEVWTGPEVPVRTSPAALLAHAVARSPLAEGTRAHVAEGDGPVAWFEVPFCNLVIGRRLLDELAPLRTDVPWDLDDFVVCRAAEARGARFRNRPDLVVAHDRYPDRVGDWLRAKGQARRRTGQKLVHHPDPYLRLPGAVVAAAVPWVGIAGLAVAGRHRPRLVRVGAVAYGAAVLAEGWRTGRRGTDVARFAAALAALHAVSIVGMQVGVAEALVDRALGRPDPLADDPGPAAPDGPPWSTPAP